MSIEKANGFDSQGSVAVLGAGKMGSSLLTSIGRNSHFADVRATVKHTHRAALVSKQLGIQVTTNNAEAVRKEVLGLSAPLTE